MRAATGGDAANVIRPEARAGRRARVPLDRRGRDLPERALFAILPRLAGRVPLAPLARVPTPVTRLAPGEAPGPPGIGDVWVKREDLSSPVYGGNKVRTLETFFGALAAAGARRVVVTGAYGSNHAVAAILHGPRVGFDVAAALFPQPPSETALENLRVVLARRALARPLPSVAALPLAWVHRRGPWRGGTAVMPPGGATPAGAIAHVGAALEVALQVEARRLPPPRAVLLPVGSTCTTAGLLAGFALASRLGLGFRAGPPRVVAVRVTPWPVTAAARIVGLAARTGARVARLAGEPRAAADPGALRACLEVDGSALGGGYGRPTPEGREAAALFRRLGGAPVLDTTYSAKAAAALLARLRRGLDGPVLFWATKSSAPLPPVPPDDALDAPPRVRRFIECAARLAAPSMPANAAGSTGEPLRGGVKDRA